MNPINRRDYMKSAAAMSLAAAVNHNSDVRAAPAAHAPARRDEFCCFSESFQDWSIDEVCRRFREIGLDGVDLTVRPGGHIDPQNVAAELPAAAKAAATHKVRISMLSTSVNSDDAVAEAVIGAAGAAGVTKIKLGYTRYRTFGKLLKEVDQARRALEGIAKLARRHQVLPCLHIHSGDMIPSSGPITYLVVKDFSPEEIGVYVDPMHMTIEGGRDGWRQGIDLVAPWIALSSLKNFSWQSTGRDATGQERWKIVKCSLADGVAPVPEYLATLRQVGYRGLFTLHSEYTDKNSWKQLSVDDCLRQTQDDLDYARRFLST